MVNELSLGAGLPLIKRVGQPYLSDDGLWIDCQIVYGGSAFMSVETKINLRGLTDDSEMAENEQTDAGM